VIWFQHQKSSGPGEWQMTDWVDAMVLSGCRINSNLTNND
jgi:hypothetical protein